MAGRAHVLNVAVVAVAAGAAAAGVGASPVAFASPNATDPIAPDHFDVTFWTDVLGEPIVITVDRKVLPRLLYKVLFLPSWINTKGVSAPPLTCARVFLGRSTGLVGMITGDTAAGRARAAMCRL